MRKTHAFLMILALASCIHKSESIKTAHDPVSPDSSKASATSVKTAEYNKHQDSLRNVILQKKENTILKTSFLQEMYIRNVAHISKDSVWASIPFDLHGPDCMAPDCYSTNVRFGFKTDGSFRFPKVVPFQEDERGCVDKETHLKGNFQLMEQAYSHVIYHSAKHKRTLVLFSTNQKSGTTAYYFTDVDETSVNGANVYRIVKEYDEENADAVYPFMSWVLTTNEYESFLK